jgi:hypothetical protein
MLERQVLHELMEVYNYFHCYEQETDARLKGIWEEFLHMELTHAQLWGEMLRKYEGRDPEVVFGDKLTVEFKFQENKEYVRHVLQEQVNLREIGATWVDKSDLPRDWPSYSYQDRVNADGDPSEEMVDLQVSTHNGHAQHAGDDLLARARTMALEFRETATERGSRGGR